MREQVGQQDRCAGDEREGRHALGHEDRGELFAVLAQDLELQFAADQEADDPQGEVIQGFDLLDHALGDQTQAAFADEQADENGADDLRDTKPAEDACADGSAEYGDAQQQQYVQRVAEIDSRLQQDGGHWVHAHFSQLPPAAFRGVTA